MAQANLEALIDCDDDELFIELGRELLGDGLSFGPEDFARYKGFAISWLDEHIAEMRAAVCGHRAAKTVTGDTSSDALIEMATVADCLAALYGKPAAMVAAVILVRRGLDALCGRE
jgi:hypothetical protein